MNPHFDISLWPYLVRKQQANKVYYYVHLGTGNKCFRVHGTPGTPDFIRSYNEAMTHAVENKVNRETVRINSNRIGVLIEKYFESGEFNSRKRWTQRNKRWSLKLVGDAFGHKRYSAFKKIQFTTFMNRLQDRPGTANQALSDTRTMLTWAQNQGFITHNELVGVKRLPYPKQPHKAWTDAELERFARAYDYDTQERLAFELLNCLGARSGDIIRLGLKNLQGDLLHYVSEKTGTPVTVRMTADLQMAIAAQPVVYDTFLVQPRKKKPFPDYQFFHSWFYRRLQKLAIRKGAHGIRKNVAMRQLEAGGSMPGAMATQGWTTPKTLMDYAREMDRRKIGIAASKYLPRLTHSQPELTEPESATPAEDED